MDQTSGCSSFSTPARAAPGETQEEELMVDEDGLVLSPTGGSDSDTSAALNDLASPMPADPETAIRIRRRDLRREEKWWGMLKDWNPDEPVPSKVKSRARKGVPKCLRGQVWPRMALSCIDASRSNHRERYASLVTSKCPFEDQISKDIGRTFPEHVWFKALNGSGQRALFNVLKAFAVQDPEVGYTQGMGFVTGQFLLHMSEENAFLLLTQLSERYGMSDMWRKGFPRLMEDMWVFESLLHQFDSELAVHLRTAGMVPALYVVEWFMTVFASVLPNKCVCRIWDVLFAEGCDKLIFRVAIALMTNFREELLSHKIDGLMWALKKVRIFRPLLADPDLFMEKVFDLPLRTAQVSRTRKAYNKLKEDGGVLDSCPWDPNL